MTDYYNKESIFKGRSFGKSFLIKQATETEIANFKKMFPNKKCKISVVIPKSYSQKKIKNKWENLAKNPNVELTILFI